MNVQIVKLVTGEEILSQVQNLGQDIKLVKPMRLIIQQEGLQMFPFLMFAKSEEVVIPKEKVVMMYEPKDELANGYKQQIGSIVTAPAGVLNNEGKLVV